MSESPGPDLDQVREALRRHDERPTEDHEPRGTPDDDVPAEAGDDEEEQTGA
jgi:hypothetical protein